MSGRCELLLTEAGQAAVERHRKALAAYADNPAEWRDAYSAMVSAIIETHERRQRFTGNTILAATTDGGREDC